MLGMSVLRIDREVEEEKSTWKVHVETKNAEGKEGQHEVLECDKLILATGHPQRLVYQRALTGRNLMAMSCTRKRSE